ncbi:unnamed protein product [Allacma fusca]|uniref:DUF4806 domain-containing protein n=1 Tax=Allacma fusca TaxID=39272 RepID=A0A8J2J330_9HEXA|nr:unnamed protein product [Allacma fusca]
MASNSIPRNFCVVEFSDESTVEVVPASCIDTSRTECYSPINFSNSLRKKISKLVLHDPKWELYPIKLWKQCETYSGALECVRILQNKSKLHSDWTEHEKLKSKRKRAPPNRSEYRLEALNRSTTSEESCSDDDVNPSVLPHSDKITLAVAEERDSLRSCLDLGTTNAVIPASHIFGRSEAPLSQPFEETLFQKHEERNKKLQKLVLTKLTAIEQNISDLKKIQLSSELTFNTTEEGIPAFPLQSVDDIKTTEEWLSNNDNRLKLIRYLGRLGGNSAEQSLRFCLARICSPNLARKINYTGENGKQKFQELKLESAIMEMQNQRETM